MDTPIIEDPRTQKDHRRDRFGRRKGHRVRSIGDEPLFDNYCWLTSRVGRHEIEQEFENRNGRCVPTGRYRSGGTTWWDINPQTH